jgi:hypothetical protein
LTQTTTLTASSDIINGQNAALRPPTKPIGENSKYKATTQDVSVNAQGIA